MEGYNVNTNMFSYVNYDPYYQPPINLDPFNTRSPSVGSYQASTATPNSVDDSSEQSQLEQSFSTVPQNITNEETQTYKTQWTQPFVNTHYSGYYPQSTAPIAPYIRGYAPHWAAMGNFMMDNPWYRYNQTYLPVSLQQEDEASSETTWPDNSSNSTVFDGAIIKQENIDSCSENLTGGFESENLTPQSTEHFPNLQTDMSQYSPSYSSSSIPSDVVLPQPKGENCKNTSYRQINVSVKKKGKKIFTYEQRAILEKEFIEGNHYIGKNKMILLAKQLKVDEKKVRVWFQNRRVKAKREADKEFIRSIQNSKTESNDC